MEAEGNEQAVEAAGEAAPGTGQLLQDERGEERHDAEVDPEHATPEQDEPHHESEQCRDGDADTHCEEPGGRPGNVRQDEATGVAAQPEHRRVPE